MKTRTRFFNCILIIALSTFFQFAKAQAPPVQWQKCIGGSKDDYANSIIKLTDGNYLLCGGTNSHDGDFNATQGNHDAFLMKTDSAGNVIWEKTYGGSHWDDFSSVVETSSGDLIALGSTVSNDGQVSGNHTSHGADDIWLVHTNSEGDLLSQHCYGGTGNDDPGQVIITSTGNVVFDGRTSSNDGDVTNNRGDYDGWVVKLDQSEDIEWAVTIGDTAFDVLGGITEIKGYLFVAGTTSIHKSTFPNNELYYDAFVAKLDEKGNTIYKIKYGGSYSDNCNAIVRSADGNAVLVGHTNSEDGDVSGNKGWNLWTWKIAPLDGHIIWNSYSGVVADTIGGFGIFATTDGGTVSLGTVGENLLANFKSADDYAAKVDANGNVLWTKQFGGGKFDALYGGVEENDGSTLLVGDTRSNNKDVSGNHGGYEDAWLADLSADGQPQKSFVNIATNNFSLRNGPNPFTQTTIISFRLTSNEYVSLKIFDAEGKLIRTLSSESMSAGMHELTWDARDENGNAVNAGIYFLKIQSFDFSQTKKLLVVKYENSGL